MVDSKMASFVYGGFYNFDFNCFCSFISSENIQYF